LRDSHTDRLTILREMGKISGVFVPSLYDTATNRLGEIFPDRPRSEETPETVEKRIITDFEHSYYPTKQIVPTTKVIHHRLALEVMRGCPGGCRFCQAGYTDRPVRERSPERLLRDAREGLKQTGFDELGLLSLSTADYTHLPDLCSCLIRDLYPQRVALSLPSLRVDRFPARVTDEIGKVRNTGLTFAPEAGTERLRWAINKLIFDAQIFSTVRESVTSNQDTVKFYFMVGLPTETDDDLQGIVDLVLRIKALLREDGKKRSEIHVGLSPFVPKPHTAYQWYGQISLEEIERRVQYVTSRLKVRGVKVNWHDPQKSPVESALARGDARLGAVIRTAYENGARFDEWREHFSYSRWESAFAAHGLSLRDYAAKTYEREDRLPWRVISIRIDPRYLWREWEKTFRGKESRHCGNEKCRVCRVCDGDEIVTIHAPESVSAPVSRYNLEHDVVFQIDLPSTAPEPLEEKSWRYRVKFSKTGSLRYASHHDLMGLFDSMLRRAGIELAFSEGFHPHPKIMFASALPVGVESLGEYADIQTRRDDDPESLLDHVNRFCPSGLRWLDVRALRPEEDKVTTAVSAFRYAVDCSWPNTGQNEIPEIQETLDRSEIARELDLLSFAGTPIANGFRILYTCAVQGGKYTKPETILERLRTHFELAITVVKVVRLELVLDQDKAILKNQNEPSLAMALQ